ncbi:MAG: outer membrane lipoprotein-sorting protein [Candidatus Neomarinimicrobiota bacterium]
MKNIILMLFPILVFSQSGRDIAEMIENRPAPDDLINQTVMILTNSKGKTRTHKMISKSKNGSEKQIIWFMEPKDDRGIAFLKIEHEDRDDEMRMWLPAFKKVRRISSKKKSDSFMGSDLSFEDLSNRRLNGNDYKRLEDAKWLGRDCYVLETVPKKESKSNYVRHVSWIDKSHMNILKEQSFNKKNKLEKEKHFSYETRGKYQLIKKVNVENLLKKHATEIIFSDIVINSGISDKLFNDISLRRLPLE